VQEGQEVIALPGLPRSLIAYGPLPFLWIEGAHCGSVGGGGELMEWAGILAWITGTVDQELLLRNEYLARLSRSGPKGTHSEPRGLDLALTKLDTALIKY
jgi:hypothetical protein